LNLTLVPDHEAGGVGGTGESEELGEPGGGGGQGDRGRGENGREDSLLTRASNGLRRLSGLDRGNRRSSAIVSSTIPQVDMELESLRGRETTEVGMEMHENQPDANAGAGESQENTRQLLNQNGGESGDEEAGRSEED
jgi:hypothetical protein